MRLEITPPLLCDEGVSAPGVCASASGCSPLREPRHLLCLLIALTLLTSWVRADYPIASHRYLADPTALVHEGRVYLYCSNDNENTVEGGYIMKSLVCVSSIDLMPVGPPSLGRPRPLLAMGNFICISATVPPASVWPRAQVRPVRSPMPRAAL